VPTRIRVLPCSEMKLADNSLLTRLHEIHLQVSNLPILSLVLSTPHVRTQPHRTDGMTTTAPKSR
jgi:hypothetical protein